MSKKNYVYTSGAAQELSNPLPDETIPIGFGYRPSGVVHLGNINTLLCAGYLVEAIGKHRASIVATNCDLELPSTQEREKLIANSCYSTMQNLKESAIYFKYLEDNNRCHQNMADHNNVNFESILNQLLTQKRVHSSMLKLSEIQSESQYRSLLRKFCENIESIAPLFPHVRGERLKSTGGGAYIHQVCPDCHTSNMYGSTFSNGILESKCIPCDKTIENDIEDPSLELAVNFLLDPLRDMTDAARVRIHVMGGDYAEELPGSPFTKIDKIYGIMEAVAESPQDVPLFFIAPTFYAEDGRKMGKSSGNGLSYKQIKEQFDTDEEAFKALYNFTSSILSNGMRHVDFSVVKEHLLS